MWFRPKNENLTPPSSDSQAASSPPDQTPPTQKITNEIELAQRDLMLACLEAVNNSPPPPIASASKREIPTPAAQPAPQPVKPPIPPDPTPKTDLPIPYPREPLPSDFSLDQNLPLDLQPSRLSQEEHQLLEEILSHIVNEDMNRRESSVTATS